MDFWRPVGNDLFKIVRNRLLQGFWEMVYIWDMISGLSQDWEIACSCPRRWYSTLPTGKLDRNRSICLLYLRPATLFITDFIISLASQVAQSNDSEQNRRARFLVSTSVVSLERVKLLFSTFHDNKYPAFGDFIFSLCIQICPWSEPCFAAYTRFTLYRLSYFHDLVKFWCKYLKKMMILEE